MNPTSNNREKWSHFLSSMESFKNLQPNNLKIKTKRNIRCLATEFANKLLGTVTEKPGDLDISKNQTETPNTTTSIPLVQNQPIDNTDEPTRLQARGELILAGAAISESSVPQTETSGHVKETSAQNADANIPKVPQRDTNKHAKETSAQNAAANIPAVPQTETNEHVNETSAQNAAANIPAVPQTETNEHVKETSAQSADANITKVPQTDTNKHAKETSAQNAAANIPAVPQTETNEHVKGTTAQNADANIPAVPQTETNEHVNETSAQNAAANIPAVPQTETNKYVKETSAQSTDANIPKVPQTDTNIHAKETSAQNAAANIPAVPQTETNEHVKETSAQNADANIPAVPQTETNGHVNETSAQNAAANIPAVPQTETNEHVKETSAQNAAANIPAVPQTETNEHVKETSAQNADVNIPKVPQTDTNKHAKETSPQSADTNIEEESRIYAASMDIELSPQNMPLASREFQRKRYRNTHSPSNKTDMDKSCSLWKISNIAEYFSFADCVTKLEIPTTTDPYSDDSYEIVAKEICCRLEMVKAIDLTAGERNVDSQLLMQLKSVTCTETGCRLVLDVLLNSLCSTLALQIELEKNINCTFLPNCTFDYCIRKGEHIIGCVEAKSVKALNDTSIAQAVIQLMILQTTLMETATSTVDISEFPVFAIVTDGHRFIYMQLKGSSLRFEHDGDKLKIRKVKEKSDFKDILQHISFLVNGAVGHLV